MVFNLKRLKLLKNRIAAIFKFLGIYRKSEGRFVSGICIAFSSRYQKNVWQVRGIYLLSVFISLGITFLLYVLLTLVIPLDKTKTKTNYQNTNDDYIDVTSREL